LIGLKQSAFFRGEDFCQKCFSFISFKYGNSSVTIIISFSFFKCLLCHSHFKNVNVWHERTRPEDNLNWPKEKVFAFNLWKKKPPMIIFHYFLLCLMQIKSSGLSASATSISLLIIQQLFVSSFSRSSHCVCHIKRFQLIQFFFW